MSVMMLNMPKIPEKIKTCYNIESVELFMPNPLCCYKYQRYVHHEEKCNTAKWNVGDMERKILTIPRTNVRKSANAQTVVEIIQSMQEFEKWKKRNISSKIHKNHFLLGSEKNCRYHKKRRKPSRK